jgi:hypothetical protein
MAAATPPGAGSGEVRPGAVHPGPVVGHPEGGVIDTSGSPFCRVRSVDLDAVRWLPGFWGDRFRQCCEVTLPLLYELMIDPQRGHALTNLRIAAGLEQGEFAGTHWQDEWVYKWLEAASYIYGVTREQRLDKLRSAAGRAFKTHSTMNSTSWGICSPLPARTCVPPARRVC